MVDLCPTIRCCIITSEVLTDEDRTILSKGFGVKVIENQNEIINNSDLMIQIHLLSDEKILNLRENHLLAELDNIPCKDAANNSKA